MKIIKNLNVSHQTQINNWYCASASMIENYLAFTSLSNATGSRSYV